MAMPARVNLRSIYRLRSLVLQRVVTAALRFLVSSDPGFGLVEHLR